MCSLLRKIILLMFLAGLLCAGCTGDPVYTPPPAPSPTGTPAPTPSPSPSPSPTPTPDPIQIKQAFIDSILDDMTTEEMVGQVFMLACRRDAAGEPVLAASQGFSDMVDDYALGGVILYADNIRSVDQTVGLIADIQAQSAIPLFISVDEEGGRVSRIGANEAMGATRFPPMARLGAIGDAELAYAVGSVIGAEMHALGFNMDMAPVADVNTNPQNPVIGDRSFASDPQIAGQMAAAFVTGMQDTGVAAVIKHFPGHGDTASDTHEGTVSVSHDMDRLRSVELIPFAAGIEAGALCVMSAHIQVPHVIGDDTPATLSSVMLTDLLRGEMGFGGLILSDALEMKAIAGQYTSAQACVQSFIAGADILLMPISPEQGYQAMLAAVQDGVIPMDRLRGSVSRILSVKYDLGLFAREPHPDPESVLGSEAHLAVARAVEAGGLGSR